MNHAKIIISLTLTTLLLTGCYSQNTKADLETYNTVVTKAKTAIKAAKLAHYEWRDSGKILKKADQAAKAGDFSKAIKLANQAKRQGDMALTQSKNQTNAKPHS